MTPGTIFVVFDLEVDGGRAVGYFMILLRFLVCVIISSKNLKLRKSTDFCRLFNLTSCGQVRSQNLHSDLKA